jgi:hypothetical protein
MPTMRIMTEITYKNEEDAPCAEEIQLLTQEKHPELIVDVYEVPKGCPANCCHLCRKM